MATLERDETQGQNFLAQLSTLHPENIVYVDESGMDSRDEYDYGWSLKGQRFHALKSGHRLGRVNIYDCGSVSPKLACPIYGRRGL